MNSFAIFAAAVCLLVQVSGLSIIRNRGGFGACGSCSSGQICRTVVGVPTCVSGSAGVRIVSGSGIGTIGSGIGGVGGTRVVPVGGVSGGVVPVGGVSGGVFPVGGVSGGVVPVGGVGSGVYPVGGVSGGVVPVGGVVTGGVVPVGGVVSGVGSRVVPVGGVVSGGVVPVGGVVGGVGSGMGFGSGIVGGGVVPVGGVSGVRGFGNMVGGGFRGRCGMVPTTCMNNNYVDGVDQCRYSYDYNRNTCVKVYLNQQCSGYGRSQYVFNSFDECNSSCN